QSLEDRLKFVDSKLRQVLEAVRQQTYLRRVGRLTALFGTQSGVFQFHDVGFDLEPGHRLESLLMQMAQHSSANVPRRNEHRGSIGEIKIGQHPRCLWNPGQNTE